MYVRTKSRNERADLYNAAVWLTFYLNYRKKIKNTFELKGGVVVALTVKLYTYTL